MKASFSLSILSFLILAGFTLTEAAKLFGNPGKDGAAPPVLSPQPAIAAQAAFLARFAALNGA